MKIKALPVELKVTSRRNFLGAAATTVAAAAMAESLSAQAQTAEATAAASASPPSDGTQKAFADSMASPATRADFSEKGITGAQLFANLCKDENLAALFLTPGNYTISQEIAQVGIPTYGGRSEGAMCAAADGFSRATGEVTACSGTEGPGFTNMIMNIAAAHFANTPLLVLASNRNLASEDSSKGIQFMYQQNQTVGIRKYGKRITAPERIHEYGSYAFRHLKSGVPGVVHLDFPAEVSETRYTDPSKLVNYFDKSKYRSESRSAANPAELRKAVEMIGKSERPVIVAGHGVHIRKAWAALLRAAEKNEIAVVGSGPVRGNFPDDHRLSLSMANDALLSADLVIFVGQYLMPNVGEWTFTPGVATIRVQPLAEELGRNWPVDLGLVSDEGLFLEALADALPRRKRDTWVAEMAAAKAKWEATNLGYYNQGLQHTRSANALHPAVLCKETHDFLYKGSLDPKQTVTGYGGLTIGGFAGRWLRAFRPAQEIVTHYQFGAMGPEMPMMLGASAAVQLGVGPQAAYRGAPALVVCGDGGIGYYFTELETAAKYRIPLIVVVYNNNCWGTFGFSRNTPKSAHIHLFQENIRYDKAAESFGARGEYCRTPEEYRAALARAYDAAAKERLSTLINCQGARLFSQASTYPPGTLFCPEPGVGALMH